MEMKELNDLVELAREAEGKKTFVVGEQTWFIDGDGSAHRIKETCIPEREVELHTLTGLLDYIQSEKSILDKPRLRIDSPTRVYFEGALDKYGRRAIEAVAEFQTPGFAFEHFYEQEEMNIALQSRFVSTPDREILLKVIGNLQESEVKQASDDGVSQQVQIKAGVASVADVKVPNPVSLAPYRTFLEVEQPTSKFIFRMRSGMQSAIFEADGGMWKIEATQKVKKYLEDELKNRDLNAIKVIA
ncbi:MAG: hypothetical protein ABF624_01590 [Liquorilactobacillus ghanensis]|uniref:hypothetical protein n=2 Tax=Liquorilactobacillus ghanensis TaxID=399370 RepID=UPI0039EC1C2A